MRPTLEQIYCYKEILIDQYEEAGMPNAYERVVALAKDVHEYFNYLHNIMSHERLLSKTYKTRNTKFNKNVSGDIRFENKRRLRLNKDIGRYRTNILLFQSVNRRKQEKFERRIAKFPELDCDLPVPTKKELLQHIRTETQRRNLKKSMKLGRRSNTIF